MSVYRKIVNTPQVRLLSPYVHPHEAIQHTEAVVTINSTAGFESLLFHKPVVVLGNVSYRGYGATIDVKNVVDLPHKITEALDSPPPDWRIDRLIWSMMQASYPGNLYDFTQKNLKTVAKSIMRRIEELELS
jgi:hypothetical protein